MCAVLGLLGRQLSLVIVVFGIFGRILGIVLANTQLLHQIFRQMLQIVVDDDVIGGLLVLVLFSILGFKAVKHIVKLRSLVVTSGLFEEILLSLDGTHAVGARQALRTPKLMGDVNGLVPKLQIAQRTGVHEEHLCFRFAAQCTCLVRQRDFYGFLRVADAPLAIRDQRQIIKIAVHTIGGAELAQRQLVLALTVGNEGQGLAGEVHAGRLMSCPLGMLQSGLRIVLLKRICGEDMQADVLGVLLGQAAQTLTLVGREHGPR